MLCPGCGHEVEGGRECRSCGRRVHVDLEALETRFCTGCGNEYFGEECPDCPAEAIEPEPEMVDDYWDVRRRERTALCPRCGHEVAKGAECGFCAVQMTLADEQSEPVTRLCVGCGNVVHGNGDCPVCEAGRAPRRRTTLHLCPGCGNEVADVHRCPICLAGRNGRKEDDRGPVCPQCDEVLEEQKWDGLAVLVCASCQGCLFGVGGLERTLDKLRSSADTTDLEALVEDYRKRLHTRLPKQVRYKPCPICHTSMTRRNYKRTSGIIVEVCGQHGMWVDQHTFGQLTDFVTKGAEAFAARKKL